MSGRRHAKPLASDEVLPEFQDDGPNGEYFCICQGCGFGPFDVAPVTKCPGCNKFIVYRPWWEW